MIADELYQQACDVNSFICRRAVRALTQLALKLGDIAPHVADLLLGWLESDVLHVRSEAFAALLEALKGRSPREAPTEE